MKGARVLGVIAMTVCFACAEGGSQATKPRDTSGVDALSLTAGGLPWDRMVDNGIPVSSADAASSDLAFPAVLPSALGPPDSIQMTDPISAAEKQRAFGAMFSHDEGLGIYWILEQPAEVEPDELLSLLDCKPENGCEGERAAIDLGGGVVGVVIAGSEVMSVRWISRGVQFDVIGPAATLSEEEVSQLAATVAAAAQTS